MRCVATFSRTTHPKSDVAFNQSWAWVWFCAWMWYKGEVWGCLRVSAVDMFRFSLCSEVCPFEQHVHGGAG